jgi:uncharacterized membrane protein YccC
MNPNWALIFQFTVGLLTVLAAIYATRVSRKGKVADQEQLARATEATAEQADRKQRFEEITTSLAAARADLTYYKEELNIARAESRAKETEKVRLEAEMDAEKERLQAEWVKRFQGLLDRCQLLADQLAKLIDGDLDIPVDQKMRISRAIGTMEKHIREDHQNFTVDGENVIPKHTNIV